MRQTSFCQTASGFSGLGGVQLMKM